MSTEFDDMSIDDLVNKIKKLAYSIDNHISDDPTEAMMNCYTLIAVTTNLKERIGDYLSDDE